MIVKLILAVLSISAIVILSDFSVSASPYGAGLYNADVPYGGETHMSLATNGNVSVAITPTLAGASASSTSAVTVTSTDVVGYKLYVRAISTSNLTNSVNGAVLGATTGTFSSPLPLALNTWGYNIDGSANYAGMTTTDQEVRTRTGPYKNGDLTTFTYGVKLDYAKSSGSYQTNVLYTAVPRTN